jgi:hypothetical protein
VGIVQAVGGGDGREADEQEDSRNRQVSRVKQFALTSILSLSSLRWYPVDQFKQLPVLCPGASSYLKVLFSEFCLFGSEPGIGSFHSMENN